MAIHRIQSNDVSLGQRFIRCTCGKVTTGGAYDNIAERNHACHVRQATGQQPADVSDTGDIGDAA